MIQRWIACLLVVALLAAQVAAQPAAPAPPPVTSSVTVMVLPIDGDAAPALRTTLTSQVERAVQRLGTVKSGTTTLSETAAAVGCDPATPECAESVRTTLAVDVLVYGTATTKDGQVELVIRKKEKDQAPIEVRTSVSASTEPPPELDSIAMRPLTGEPEPRTCIAPSELHPDGCHAPAAKKKPRTDRALGITAMIGAGVFLIGGLSLWNEKSKKQELIDDAPTNTLADFQALEVLEDDAGKKALYGNVMVLGAIGATAIGIWLLKRDRKTQRDAAVRVTPTVTSTGAGVWITIGAH